MADRGIFPVKDADFNTYFGTVFPYLTTHAVRLNVSAGNLSALGTLKTTWDTKFPQSQNEDTATKTIIEEKTQTRTEIEELLRVIYGDIPQSALTTADRNTLNLKKRKAKTAREAITTAPGIMLFDLGGMQIRFEFRVVGDESRPSIHPKSNGLELRMAVSPTPLTSISQMQDTVTSTRASFKQYFEQDLAGQTLYLFARWKNSTDPSKSGPWSAIAQVVIR